MSYELPLFPLHTVLFPGMPLALQVFEPRYLRMLNHCIEDRQPFGVVLIRRGSEALGPLAEPYMVGCTARVLRIERKLLGRMNIIAVGGERFEIETLTERDDYLVGAVRQFGLTPTTVPNIDMQASQLRPWMQLYIDLLRDAEVLQDVPLDLPPDPVELAFMGAFLLQISAHQKQALLELESSAEILQEVQYYFRREVALARHLLAAAESVAGGTGQLN